MVKRVGSGGTKRKIDKMEKITKREYRATTFSKRCFGLYSKASQLCLLSGAQIAILATPPSSQSNVSFYSFGHSSVDAVVNAYLTGQRLAPVREEPMEEDIGILMARKELGLELWWEKESLSKSKDPRELMDAMKAIERMLSKLRSGDFLDSNESFVNDEGLKNNEMAKSDDVVFHQGTQEPDETLDLQGVCCVPGDDLVVVSDKITEEQDQMLASCDSFCSKEDNNINGLSGSLDVYNNQEMDIDELIDWTTIESSAFEFDDGVLDSTQELAGRHSTNFEAAAHDVSTNPYHPIYNYHHEGVEDEALVFQSNAWDEVTTDVSTVNPYLIYDEATTDVSTNPSLPIYNYHDQGVEDEALVFQNNAWDEASTDVSTVDPYLIYGFEEEAFVFQNRANLDEDNLQFTDYFNELTTVAAV